MGLDAYFYKKPKQTQETPIEDIVKIISSTANEDLKTQLKKLKYLCNEKEKDFESTLARAIEHYIDHAEDSSETELGYFRKFWWLNDEFFHYSDANYAQDMPVTKEQIQELNTLSKKILMMVEKHFTDKGLIIEKSPLNFSGTTVRWGGSKAECLTFTNSLFTQDMENEADTICEDALQSSDAFLFHKVCDLYIYTKSILAETDFDTEQIVYNANW